MAGYAALVSLRNLLEQLQRHPQPPITLDTNQIQTLTQKIAFLLDFLEVYNSHYSKPEVERLRNRIADAAYAAEDAIETHIVNQIRARSLSADEEGMVASSRHFFCCFLPTKRSTADASTICDEENICSIDLHEAIQNMCFVEEEVLEIEDMLGTQDPQRFITTDVVASKSTSTEHNIMVGFDDVLIEMLDKLTGHPHSRCQIIPIYGMGGIGKTTLARNAYINPLTECYFDVRAWITISQRYTIQDILLGVLCEMNQGSGKSSSEVEIGEKLYKSLFGRRYLIVMDDMWNDEAWVKVKRFFPNECNGSRIVVTTRLTNLASSLTSNCCGLKMDFLDEDKSWSLFCKTVFGEEDGCPSKLENIGKEISKNCKGLPLSIIVLGGLLSKSERTHEYWEYIAENLNSVVNLEENERCFKILHTSYDELPAHLKPCFLYMGVFPEDREIRISKLIGMWVAESFLKPINGKGLEESAKEYLMDLAGRNLIMVHVDELTGLQNFCNIHDLLRELCIREARNEKFICVANQHGECINTQRLVAIHQDTSKKVLCLDSLKGGSIARSLICYSRDVVIPLAELRLLRVCTRTDSTYPEDLDDYTSEDIFRLVNMRYLSLWHSPLGPIFTSSLSQLWNLQTLYVGSGWYGVVAPPEIWKMPLIRDIQINGLILPDPPSSHTDGRGDFVLHDLHTLIKVINLKLGEEVIKRIPNIRKLALEFDYKLYHEMHYNFGRLCKLEDLSITFATFKPPNRTALMQNLSFPHSLKKLALEGTFLHWEDVRKKIGSLPRLQILILGRYSFIGQEWETMEGQFCSLKYLEINYCDDLKCWSTESTHFPCLESLHLVDVLDLEEIPLCIGDITTLKSIMVDDCSDSVVISAKRILDEQEELGNLSLRVRVKLDSEKNDRSLEELATLNFQFVD